MKYKAVWLHCIYVGGKLVPMTARVFVYTVDRTMRPIPLTNEELGQVLVPESPVWLRKIEPVIDVSTSMDWQASPTQSEAAPSPLGEAERVHLAVHLHHRLAGVS